MWEFFRSPNFIKLIYLLIGLALFVAVLLGITSSDQISNFIEAFLPSKLIEFVKNF